MFVYMYINLYITIKEYKLITLSRSSGILISIQRNQIYFKIKYVQPSSTPSITIKKFSLNLQHDAINQKTMPTS